MESAPFSGSDHLPPADIFPCIGGNSSSSDPLIAASSASVSSNDSVLADGARIEGGVGDSTLMDVPEDENNWFDYKPAINEDLGMLHNGLDMVDIDDCPSVFAGESMCNTLDLDAIVDLGLNTTDVMIGTRSRNFTNETEVIYRQSCFTDSTNQAVDSVLGNSLLQCGNDTQADTALTAVGSIQFADTNILGEKTRAKQLVSASSDVPLASSSVPLLSSAKCEQATSFLTPKTPTHSQGLPTYATHFSFFSPDMSPQTGAVSVSRPKTPVVSVSLPVCAHPLLSPHTPYTPDTPSMFQFPSPNQSPASSTGCSPASRHPKRHTANYHPYNSPSAVTGGPRYTNQQLAAAQQLEQQKRLEMKVADIEIDEYIRQLKQADVQQRQPLPVTDVCPKPMSSKLSLTLPAETEVLSDTTDVSSSVASCQQVVSPIDEVIQFLVAEHFGVTVPLKLRQGDAKCTDHSPILCSDLTSLPMSADGIAAKEFRNPDTLPTSKPRKRKPEPLVIPASVSNFGFRSQLRSPKLLESGTATRQCHSTTPPPYTPPPMISPARTGSGLFWTLHGTRMAPAGPLSAPPCQTSFLCMCHLLLYLIDSINYRNNISNR